MEHLDILGAIRLTSNIKLKKFEEYYTRVLDGYACVGIRKESEEYKSAVELLKLIKIGEYGLRNNIFLDGYVRLDLVNKAHIDDLLRGYIKLKQKKKMYSTRFGICMKKMKNYKKKLIRNLWICGILLSL